MTTNDLTDPVFHVRADQLDYVEHYTPRYDVVHYRNGSEVVVDRLLSDLVVS